MHTTRPTRTPRPTPSRPHIAAADNVDAPDIWSKLTPEEYQQLRLQSLLQQWEFARERIVEVITPPRNKREAARWTCPYGCEEAVALREHGEYLISLADQIESMGRRR